MSSAEPGGSGLPRPGGPYSLARKEPGGTVYVSGQIGVDPSTGILREGGIGPQAEQAIKNVAAILAASGCGLSDVLKVSVFLADIDDFNAMNDVYSGLFSQPFPVRTTVQAGLARGALIEVDAIAQLDHIDLDARTPRS
jgi:2-iminobutanoate/2-iminopropanoate deaminase